MHIDKEHKKMEIPVSTTTTTKTAIFSTQNGGQEDHDSNHVILQENTVKISTNTVTVADSNFVDSYILSIEDTADNKKRDEVSNHKILRPVPTTTMSISTSEPCHVGPSRGDHDHGQDNLGDTKIEHDFDNDRTTGTRNRDSVLHDDSDQNAIMQRNTKMPFSEKIFERFKSNHYVLKAREISGTIVNNSKFQLCIVYLILINATMMGLATFNFVEDNPNATNAFEITDKIFLVLFTIELVMQFMYHGVYLFSDGWLVFDFIIVLMSWSLESLQIVRTFRIFRALRLVTRVRTLKNLVSALFSVGPRMSAIFALLALIFYIYGVMCTVLFKNLFIEGHTDNDYFSRLDVTCWTLLIIMTLDWAEITRQVMDVYPNSWVIFVSFVMITSFIAYNLIIAVVCDSVNIIEAKQKEDDHRKHMADAIESEIEEEETLTEEEQNQLKLYHLRQRIDSIMKQQQAVLKKLDATLVQIGAEPTEEPQASTLTSGTIDDADAEIERQLQISVDGLSLSPKRSPDKSISSLKSSLKSSIRSSIH